MVTFDLQSPMRNWRPGDYPVSPFIFVTANDKSGAILQSTQLMTSSEIDYFFNRVMREVTAPPKYIEPLREQTKRELALQQARMLGRR